MMPMKKVAHTLTLLCLLIAVLFGCLPDKAVEGIMTVNGLIPSDELGRTLSHEHVLVDWIGADSTGYHRWDREEVVETVLPYFLEVKERGINTIVEYTPAYLGRDPYILQELSRRSGLNIVTNTGYYGAVNNQFMPEDAFDESADEIASRWIEEFNTGIDGSGIKPGFVKISVASEKSLSEFHKKIIEAAAITHLNTGLTIASHTVGDLPALEQIEILKGIGVSPEAWIWTHAQSGSAGANIQAAESGAWISLDNVNYQTGAEGESISASSDVVQRIVELQKAGFLDRILLSHDAGWYSAGEPGGGEFRGYTDISDHLIPELRTQGFTDDDIRQLMELNPQKAYGISRKRHQSSN